MSVLFSVQNLSAVQGSKTLFQNIAFGIEDGEKCALIGVNGCGKTTLLSLIQEAVQTPHPNVMVRQGLSIGYLPQLPFFSPDDTILDHLFSSQSKIVRSIKQYHAVLDQLETHPSPDLERQLAEASETLDHLDAWPYEQRVASILKELHIHDLTQKMAALSGGMIKKIGLAQTFFEDVDLLILDEPTNHLDVETIQWLTVALKKRPSAVLMVTHDRYFLDSICTKIFEIDQQTLFTIPGNYQRFLEQRDFRYSSQKREQDVIQSTLRREMEWLKRGPKARSTKQKARKDRIYDMMSSKKFSPEAVLELGVQHQRLGKKIIDVKKIKKSFNGQLVITDFTYAFTAGEKIGVIGPNGVGKTTFLNVMTEQLEPDSGTIEVGQNTRFAYFDQHSRVLDDDKTIYEHISSIGDTIELYDGSRLSASKLLERFLFPSQMLSTLIGKLSGGEKRRLHLVSLLLSNPNFLVFDEPTNDLDIITLSVLEDFLHAFRGCILIISHDRYFMDRVIDKLFIFEGQGKIRPFVGSYTDYLDTLADIEEAQKAAVVSKPQEKPSASTEKKRLTYGETQEFKKLEQDIHNLEDEKVRLTNLFSSPDVPASDYETSGKRLVEIEQLLDEKLKRWEYLADYA